MIKSCLKYINETPNEYYKFVHCDAHNNKFDII